MTARKSSTAKDRSRETASSRTLCMKNIAQFFVDRPIIAAVISLLFVITGAIVVFQLPISEYPDVVPTTVVVRAAYPAAHPKVIARSEEPRVGKCWGSSGGFWG